MSNIEKSEKDIKINTTDIQLIELLTELIDEAIDHGGDAGGPYKCNKKGLDLAINNVLKFFGLDDMFKVEWDEFDNYNIVYK